jgi:hypothetical protein
MLKNVRPQKPSRLRRSRIYRTTRLPILILIGGAVASTSFSASVHVSDVYRNDEYKFAIIAPAGVRKCNDRYHLSAHGISFSLERKCGRSVREERIVVTGDFDTQGYKSSRDGAAGLCPSGQSHYSAMQLDSLELSACDPTSDDSGLVRTEEIALRPRGSGVVDSVIYSVVTYCRIGDRDRCSLATRNVVQSFRQMPR